MNWPRPALVVAVIALAIAASKTASATWGGDDPMEPRQLEISSAACPARTKLVRGQCFDSKPAGPVLGVKAAADRCAEAGGSLPPPETLWAARDVLELGDGIGSHAQFTDSFTFDSRGSNLTAMTTVVSANGTEAVENEDSEHDVVAFYEYTCLYRPDR